VIGHIFCASCIEEWKRQNVGQCPLCKQPPGNLIRLRGTASQLPVAQLAGEHTQQLAEQSRQPGQQHGVISQLRENLQRQKDRLAQQRRQLAKQARQLDQQHDAITQLRESLQRAKDKLAQQQRQQREKDDLAQQPRQLVERVGQLVQQQRLLNHQTVELGKNHQRQHADSQQLQHNAHHRGPLRHHPSLSFRFSEVLKKTTKGEIVILLHEFENLKQITKDQVMTVYEKTMGSSSLLTSKRLGSYYGIHHALRCLGVGHYSLTDFTDPDDLLAQWVHEKNRLCFDWYESHPDNEESLKRQATNRYWDLDALKAIIARWMQGRDQDQGLKAGKRLMDVL